MRTRSDGYRDEARARAFILREPVLDRGASWATQLHLKLPPKAG
jgi:hypothetical protein